MARPHTGAASETMAMWVSRRLRSIGSRLVAINAVMFSDSMYRSRKAPPSEWAHPRSAPDFWREHLLGNAAAEGQRRCRSGTRDPRRAAVRLLVDGAESARTVCDQIPQRIWKQRSGHTRSRYLADEDRASEVLLHALRKKSLCTSVSLCRDRSF